MPAGGEPVNLKEKFESTVNTVKRTENFVPFEKILNVKKLPKESEMYYLLQSEYNATKINCNKFTIEIV